MGKKKREKRKKNKDVRQLNEEFSAELTRSQSPEKVEKKKDRQEKSKDNC